MIKFLFRYKFTVLVTALIAVLSLLPSDSIPESKLFDLSFLDKIIHTGMYAFFAFVALWECPCFSRCFRPYAWTILIVILCGALIELLQGTIIRSRSAEWLDLAANATGAFIGLLGHLIRIQIKF